MGGVISTKTAIKKLKGILYLLLCTLLITSCTSKQAVNKPQIEQELALINATIIDGTGGPVIENGIILIKGERIEAIGKAGSITVPDGTKTVDLSGKYLLPGFINAHVHLAYDEVNLKNWAAAGVTTVRDMGAHPPVDYSFRDESNKKNDRARIVAGSAILTVTGGYGRDYYNSEQEAAALAQSYADKGADFIKISMEQMLQGKPWKMPTLEEQQAIVDVAHKNGMKVSVHLSDGRFINDAIKVGVDDIGHMAVYSITDERIKAVVDNNIIWEPTLELWNGVGLGASAKANLGRFYKAGGTVALGTDFGGYTITFDKGFPIKEVKLMKEAGMSNMDIIKAGTLNGAIVCDLQKEIGSLEKGKNADILIIEGNPLEDITTLQNTWMVIHNGQVVFEKKP